MTAPTLIVMTPKSDPAAGPPRPWAAAAAMDQTAILLAHWRAHGWPVARVGDAGLGNGGIKVEHRSEDLAAPAQTGPIVLTGALSAKALILSAEIARELGMAVYAPAETVFALGVSEDEARTARDLSAQILPLQQLFAAIRKEAVTVV